MSEAALQHFWATTQINEHTEEIHVQPQCSTKVKKHEQETGSSTDDIQKYRLSKNVVIDESLVNQPALCWTNLINPSATAKNNK